MCFKHLQNSDKMAVVTSRLFMETSNFSNIYCFDHTQTILTYSTVFLIRARIPEFNEIVDVFRRIVTSGLIPKWAKDFHIFKPPMDGDIPIEPLQLSQAIWMIAACYPLLALAFFAAFAEQIIFRNLSKNRKSRFWRLVDQLIDGRRHNLLLQK